MGKLYTKGSTVVDEIWTTPRYDILENGGGAFKSTMQINKSTSPSVAGTLLDAARMNNIENGIDALDTLLAGLAPQSQYQIVPTVSGNNLTLALKDIAGNNFSATNPGYFRIGNTMRTVTAALSVTKNAGTNWCNAGSAELATKEIDYFAYLGYNATDGVVLGFSRIPFVKVYSDFSATSTNARYCAISIITNAAAGDAYINIGRFAATLSAGAGYAWSVPTFTTANLVNYPIYETRVLTWVPVHTRAVAFTNAPTINVAQYFVNGHAFSAYEQHTQNATPGGSGLATFTLPFIPVSSVNIFNGSDMTIGGYFNCNTGIYNDCTASHAFGVSGIMAI